MGTQTLVLLGVLAAAVGGFYLIQTQAASEARLAKLQASWTATQQPAPTEAGRGELIGQLWDEFF